MSVTTFLHSHTHKILLNYYWEFVGQLLLPEYIAWHAAVMLVTDLRVSSVSSC